MTKLVVTGATGYIGEELLTRARQGGFHVVAASRHEPSAPHDEWMAYDLASTQTLSLPAGTDAVIHLAADTQSAYYSAPEIEIEGARRLVEAAAKISARLLFVSSQAAHPDAPTPYGRVKWRIEQMVLASGGCILRPGQVYGGSERGLYGELLRSLRRTKVFPKFVPAPMVQPIHVADLADGILNHCLEFREPLQKLYLGATEPMHFSDFLAGIAASNDLPRPVFVVVPVWLVRLAGRCLGRKLRERTGISRLESLFQLSVMDTRESLQNTGLVLRPFPDESIFRRAENRRREQQARSILSYLLKEPPGPELNQRYVQILARLDRDAGLRLPRPLLRFPVLLALLDSPRNPSKARAEFLHRLQIATIVAEASPQGARRFLGYGKASGFWSSFLDITAAVASETFWRIQRVFFAQLAEPEVIPGARSAQVRDDS